MPETKSHTTVNHDTIRRWVEERNGIPSHVRNANEGHDSGILRIDFPDVGDDENLEPISWEEFFRKFESNHLAFVYEETTHGKKSRFNKFVFRDQ